MTRDDDFIGQLEGYLDEFEGITPLPAAVRDAIHAELPTTKQLGRFIGPMRRSPFMSNNVIRFGLAAAVLVLVALLGVKFLPWSNVGGPIGSPTAKPDSTPISSPSTSSTASTEYLSDPAFPIPLTLRVPFGWNVSGDSSSESVHLPGFGWRTGIDFYVVDNLYADPCQPTRGWRDPPLGPTADDLVTVLTNLPPYVEATISTTDVDGYAAIHLDRSTAPSTFAAECRLSDVYLGEVYSGSTDRDSAVGQLALGGYPDVWVVDVDGERLLIVRRGIGERLDDLDAILASVQIGSR